MFGASEDPLHALVLERGQRALADADLLVLVGDGREGLVPGDREIARAAREANRPLLLAINKMDDSRARAGALDFYQLGIDPVFEISAEHGEGVGDLFDAILEALPDAPLTQDAQDAKDEKAAQASGEQLRRRAGRSACRGTACPPRSASPSWAGPTPASRRWSIGCCARSG